MWELEAQVPAELVNRKFADWDPLTWWNWCCPRPTDRPTDRPSAVPVLGVDAGGGFGEGLIVGHGKYLDACTMWRPGRLLNARSAGLRGLESVRKRCKSRQSKALLAEGSLIRLVSDKTAVATAA